MFSSVFHGEGVCRVAKAIYKQLCFSTWASAAGFNNNNNNNNNRDGPKKSREAVWLYTSMTLSLILDGVAAAGIQGLS